MDVSELAAGGTEPSFALSLSKAVKKLKPSFGRKEHQVWLTTLLANHQIPQKPDALAFGDFARDYPKAVWDLQQKLHLRLMVIRARKGHHPVRMSSRLVYDGRHAPLDPQRSKLSSPPLRCMCLGADGRWMFLSDNVSSLQPIHEKSYYRKCFSRARPLKHLLQAITHPEEIMEVDGKPDEDPQTEEDLMACLALHCPPHTKIVVRWATGLMKNSLVVDWCEYTSPDGLIDGAPKNLKRLLHVLAYPGRHYAIRYAEELDPGIEKALRRGKKVEQDYERYKAAWKQLSDQEKSDGRAQAFQANQAGAVCVTHCGLRLAFDLGLLSTKEMADLSRQLADTHSTLFTFLDERSHLRHVTYYDTLDSFCQEVVCFENDCEQDNDSMTDHQQDREEHLRDQATHTMMAFWDRVWQRRASWISARQNILKPLISRLENVVAQTVSKQKTKNTPEEGKKATSAAQAGEKKRLVSPYSTCLAQLKKAITHQYLFLCTQNDAHMHSLKFYLAHFAYTRVKKSRGVSLKGQSDDTLVRLTIPGLVVFNLNTFFNCNQDLDFYAGAQQPQWLGPLPTEVLVAHANKLLQKQHTQVGPAKTNLKAFCQQRGWLLARHMHRSWTAFGSFLLQTFGYEIHSLPSPPATSFLAFQCVWTLYLTMAGPMAQSLERTKPYHEDLLRNNSRGGFMFSVQSALQSGDPLDPCGPLHATARSLAEYDLLSLIHI